MKKKNAFTLAEVLITLGIIGIVAAMTLPILINKYEKKVTVTKLKKEYVMFNEAMDMLKVDKSVANIGNVGNCTEINQAILPYLNIRQSCAKPPYKCWGNENAPIDIDGDKIFADPNDGSRGYKLADGSILVLR